MSYSSAHFAAGQHCADQRAEGVHGIAMIAAQPGVFVRPLFHRREDEGENVAHRFLDTSTQQALGRAGTRGGPSTTTASAETKIVLEYSRQGMQLLEQGRVARAQHRAAVQRQELIEEGSHALNKLVHTLVATFRGLVDTSDRVQ
jgi:hypothetical protein